jgi:hypothetical protein
MNFSQTQLSNIVIAAGVIVMIAQKMGYVLEQETVVFFLGAALSIGGTAYSWYQRFKKGDLTIGGFRK